MAACRVAELGDSGAVLLSLSGRSSSAVHEAGLLFFIYIYMGSGGRNITAAVLSLNGESAEGS